MNTQEIGESIGIPPGPYESPAKEAAKEGNEDAGFSPKGAITFFMLLIVLSILIWYGIYFLMLDRA